LAEIALGAEEPAVVFKKLWKDELKDSGFTQKVEDSKEVSGGEILLEFVENSDLRALGDETGVGENGVPASVINTEAVSSGVAHDA
jgi:hypothetical protein